MKQKHFGFLDDAAGDSTNEPATGTESSSSTQVSNDSNSSQDDQTDLTDLPDLGVQVPSNRVMLASAGTGKTYQLSSRYLQLLAAGQSAERILATTFTRKAAGEIFDRVTRRLAIAVVNPKQRNELADSIGLSQCTADDCRELLASLTRNLHRLRIETLDAFFAKIARTCSFELGLPPAWNIIDEQADRRVRIEALGLTLQRKGVDEATRLLHMLTKGEAKRRISELMLEQADDVYDLYQATELEEGAAWFTIPTPCVLNQDDIDELSRLLDEVVVPANLEKPHSSSLAALRTGQLEDFVTKGLPKKIVNGETTYNRKEIPADVLAVYKPVVDQLRSHVTGLVMERIKWQTEGAYELASAFSENYERLKIDREAITFGDVTHRLSTILNQTGMETLLYRLGGKLDHLLLDEFQDTSVTQWDCLKPFTMPIVEQQPNESNESDGSASDSNRGSFFCVGDIKQAIYGWRGGQSEILATLSERLDVTPESLTDSWRSSQVIIDTVNRMFSRMDRHRRLGEREAIVREWSENFPKHKTQRDLSGYACVRVAPEPADKEQAVPELLKYCADIVKDIADQSQTHDIGILVRSNRTVGQMIFHLKQIGVLASEEGGNPLTDSAAVLQILSLIRLADHPSDLLSATHVSCGPLAERFEWQPFEKPSRVAAALLSRKLRRQLMVEGYHVCVERWAEWLHPVCSTREHQRLSQLVDLAYGYQSRSSLRPQDFEQFVKNEKVADPTSSRIRVMTIHQAKGLEFDSVVLIPLADRFSKPPRFHVQRNEQTFRPQRISRHVSADDRKLMPADLQRVFAEGQRRLMEEYLCLEYVSLTRAQRAVHVILPSGKKPDSVGPAGLYLAALAQREAPDEEGLVYEHGERDWHAKDQEQVAVSRLHATHTLPPNLSLAKRASVGRGQDVLSPSQRVATFSTNGGDFFSQSRETALERGTLIHAWMESLVWLGADQSPDRAALERIAIGLGSRLVDQSESLKEFESILAKPNVRSLLNEVDCLSAMQLWLTEQGVEVPGDLRIEVRNEQKVVIEEDGNVATGEIDRLLIAYSGEQVIAADIIDYKTDAVSAPADHTRLAEKYRPQLAAYRSAVTVAFGVDPERIRTRLFLLRADASVEVP